MTAHGYIHQSQFLLYGKLYVFVLCE